MNTVVNSTPNVIIIEGLDFLGKSALVNSIRNHSGYYEVIHFCKPQVLDAYQHADKPAVQLYQEESFRNSMLLAKAGARIIFDRWHLGECVYAPMYRGYPGDYVFDFERRHHLDNGNIRLILLTEDFSRSKHFVDDGLSLGGQADRAKEQTLFVDAFNRSIIRDKRIICVTDEDGSFRPKEDILAEALA